MLEVDPTSLRVRDGTGGMQPLGYEDKASIEQTIDDEVLLRKEHRVPVDLGAEADGGRISVEGELTLVGETRPIAFDLAVGDGGKAQRQRRRDAEQLGNDALLGLCSEL